MMWRVQAKDQAGSDSLEVFVAAVSTPPSFFFDQNGDGDIAVL